MVIPPSHCKHGHAYTPENTMWVSGDFAYRCKTCHAARVLHYQTLRYRNDPAFRERLRAYQRAYYHKHVKGAR
jgi:hypothetical protein